MHLIGASYAEMHLLPISKPCQIEGTITVKVQCGTQWCIETKTRTMMAMDVSHKLMVLAQEHQKVRLPRNSPPGWNGWKLLGVA